MQPLHPRHRRLRRAVSGGFALIGLYCGIVVALAYLFLHPPRRAVSEAPDSVGLAYENVRFPSATDPLTLAGWYLPAAGKPRGIVLFCHGRDGNRGGVLYQAGFLHDAGFALFAFDFRDCGDSGGDMTTIGWRETGDALGAVKYLQSRSDTKNLPLGIFGVSMGAAVSIQAAAQSPQIRCVVADSPYATLDSAVKQRFYGLMGPVSELLRLPVQRVGERMMGQDALSISPLAAIPGIAPHPVLLIHGTADTICPVGDSRLLQSASGGAAQLWIVPGAGHIGAIAAQPEKYRRRVTDFFTANLR